MTDRVCVRQRAHVGRVLFLAPVTTILVWLAFGLRLFETAEWSPLATRDLWVGGIAILAITGVPLFLVVRNAVIEPNGISIRYFTGMKKRLNWHELKFIGLFGVGGSLGSNKVIRLVRRRGRTVSLLDHMLGFDEFSRALENQTSVVIRRDPRLIDALLWRANSNF